jgi:hypothetical protein
LWDCSEFILSAYKLEVGHPPGAPLFMMIGHLFTAFVSPEKAAYMVNIFSALCSAFTILFLFWSITHLVRRFVDTEPLAGKIAVIGSGITGALIYTFSDTFWFSAVEGEVYAASSLITAAVFWAILKWEEEADNAYANRWLVLIAYVTGLSIGVHLLNLLVVPAIVFVYYFKKYKVTQSGIIKTGIFSLLLLALLVWGIIPVTPEIAARVELLFVNVFHLPVNSGLLFFVFVLAAALAYSVHYTSKKGKKLANTIFLSLSFCFIGFGSYAMIVIRSAADTPMNQNKPDNIYSLIRYLNRDQYGSRPLFTGPYYTDAMDYKVINKDTYTLLDDRYVKKDISQTIKYNKTILFPRMWSAKDEQHTRVYKTYVNGKNPTYIDNLHFFFDYQLGFMYWRYFMWNFVGRQNDIQATVSEPIKGNWISGIKFIDEARLGSIYDNPPQYMAENKGMNKYYFIPLILGLLGLYFQFKRDKKGFSSTMLLFFFTGIAIIIYLNQTPIEPRERDYAYAGSFYAFAIWTGMGVAFLAKLLSRILKPQQAASIALILSLSAPVIMARQNWDDHDRSGRYITTDFGYNYLESCDPNAILFTFGDNDTFSLWYNQEVEGVRTDIKVANSSYLASDWYYMQMMRRTYDAAPLKTTATPDKIIGETRMYIPVLDSDKYPYANAKSALNIAFSDDDKSKYRNSAGEKTNVIVAKELRIPVERNDATVQRLASDTAAIVPYISLNIGNIITKNKLAAIDFIANNFPQRPIYFGITGDDDFQMGLRKNLRDEGFAMKLVPENTSNSPVNIDKTFDLLVNKYRYRGLNDSKVYFDETARRDIQYYRAIFFKLAAYLKIKGDSERLKLLMEKYHEAIPEMQLVNMHVTPYYRAVNPAVDYYLFSGLTEYGISLSERLMNEYRKEFEYYIKLTSSCKNYSFDFELANVYQGVKNIADIFKQYGQTELYKRADELLKTMSESFR